MDMYNILGLKDAYKSAQISVAQQTIQSINELDRDKHQILYKKELTKDDDNVEKLV